MSRTDKDTPSRILYPDGAWRGAPYIGDSGFRKTRKWLKRNRSKHIRRYKPDAVQNGARPPYNGLKRTWDFE